MRTVLLAGALAALATASAAAPNAPAPAAAPAAVPAGVTEADWRIPDPQNVLVIDTNKGRILVELVPEVAPQFTARIRQLAQQHFYDGLTFFRVIADFMAQTGDPKNNGSGGSELPDVPAEFTFRRGADTPFASVGQQGSGEVGFVKTLPVQSQSMLLAPMTVDGRVSAWGLFCPGVAGAARAQEPDSANSQFYLMRARYPALDKRYSAFGRVIAGQNVVTSIKIGEPVPDPQDRMERVRVLADLPAAERPKIRVVDTNGAWFKAEAARVRAARGADFSACDLDIPVEVR